MKTTFVTVAVRFLCAAAAAAADPVSTDDAESVTMLQTNGRTTVMDDRYVSTRAEVAIFSSRLIQDENSVPDQCAADCASSPVFDAAVFEANTALLGGRRALRIKFLEELVYVMSKKLKLPFFATEGLLLATIRQKGFAPFDYDGDFGVLQKDWEWLMKDESYNSEPAFISDIRSHLSFPIKVVLERFGPHGGPHLAIWQNKDTAAGDWPLMDIFILPFNMKVAEMFEKPVLEFRPWYCTHLPILKGSEAWLDEHYSPCWKHVQLNKCNPALKNTYSSMVSSLSTNVTIHKRNPTANFTGHTEMMLGLYVTAQERRTSQDHCVWDLYDGAAQFPSTTCGAWIQAGALSPACTRTPYSLDDDSARDLGPNVLLNREGRYQKFS